MANKQPSVQEQMQGVVENVSDYVGKNRFDTAAYAILLIGLIISFAYPLIGGVMVGAVVAIYFGEELVGYVKDSKSWIDNFGVLKSLMCVTAILYLVISAPYFFVGLAIATAVMFAMQMKDSGSEG